MSSSSSSSSFPSMSIPAPTDSYDHDNSTRANRISIKALTAAFDASIDSLSSTIDKEMKRLDQIQIRIENIHIQNKVVAETGTGTVDVDKEEYYNQDAITQVVCPSSFLEQQDLHGTGSTGRTTGTASRTTTSRQSPLATRNKNIPLSDSYSNLSSSIAKARQAANDAIFAVLKEEAMTMQTNAKPSDVWLDRACAFEEAKDCHLALVKYRVPPLVLMMTGVNNNFMESNNMILNNMNDSPTSRRKLEAEYYRNGMSAGGGAAGGDFRNSSGAKKYKETEAAGILDDRSIVTSIMNQSVASGRYTTYTMGNYSTLSQNTQGTASYRRHQRKIRAAAASTAVEEEEEKVHDKVNGNGDGSNNEKNVAKKQATIATYEPSSGEQYYGKQTPFSNNTRQHFMSGGMSYICEMIHDTYGLGDMDQSNLIYAKKVQNVCDLFYHGTDELVYH
mmetsp:Transcript_16260/g.30767  ORF Transcript_16260/g.30767 Transcript_16260/m.30767 type:complete len:447 (-) Transcript_16260:100-1440(-)